MGPLLVTADDREADGVAMATATASMGPLLVTADDLVTDDGDVVGIDEASMGPLLVTADDPRLRCSPRLPIDCFNGAAVGYSG